MQNPADFNEVVVGMQIVFPPKSIPDMDKQLLQHQWNVCYYTLALARAMSLSVEEYTTLLTASILHDVGKMYIPQAILRKHGKLTQEELAIVRSHSEKGADSPGLAAMSDRVRAIVRQHHERWDGKGYPHGIRGEQIDILARILAVADSFDAMTTQRSYNSVKTLEEGIAEMQRCAGSQFDPEVVHVFVRKLVSEPSLLMPPPTGSI